MSPYSLCFCVYPATLIEACQHLDEGLVYQISCTQWYFDMHPLMLSLRFGKDYPYTFLDVDLYFQSTEKKNLLAFSLQMCMESNISLQLNLRSMSLNRRKRTYEIYGLAWHPVFKSTFSSWVLFLITTLFARKYCASSAGSQSKEYTEICIFFQILSLWPRSSISLYTGDRHPNRVTKKGKKNKV